MVKKAINLTEKDKFKAFRKKLGLTQLEFAQSIGSDQPAVQRYESGVYKIPTELVKKMNEVHKLDYKWFFNNIGTPIESKDSNSSGGLVKDVSVLNNNLNLVTAKLIRLEESFSKLHADYYELKHKVQYRD